MEKHRSLLDLHFLLIDMDGVLWRGDEPVPGLADFFSFLRERHIRFTLATNNASRTSDHYVQRMAGYGIDVSRDEVITSAQATAAYLAERSEPGTAVYYIGEDGLGQALNKAGFRLVGDDETPKYVVVGWDRNLTYAKLAQATVYIYDGAAFIATNPDKTWPSERGQLPGAGAILAALQAATGVEPTIIGKPSPLMLQIAIRRMGAVAANTAMLGDRLETDILGGQNAGLTTILVLSGVTKPDDLATSPVQPDLVFDDIGALTRAWLMSDVLGPRERSPAPRCGRSACGSAK
jgi:4-nitrophenyl phosphatase